MKKSTNCLSFDTFLVASLGIHLLLFLILSILSGDAVKPLMSPPRLEVHLFSIASPAIAEEKLPPKPVSPSLERKVQPPPLKILHPESAPVEKLDTRFQREKEGKRIPFVREEEKPPEESPAKEATIEWTDSNLPKDEEPLWIQTTASSSALVVSPPQEVQTSSLGGEIQEEQIQVAKGVSHFEGETPVVHPRYLNNPKPTYPQEAKQRGLQGEVTLRVEVLGSGQVGQIEIRRSSGHEILDRSALATVRQWQFVPAKRGKESVPLWVNVPITFRIE